MDQVASYSTICSHHMIIARITLFFYDSAAKPIEKVGQPQLVPELPGRGAGRRISEGEHSMQVSTQVLDAAHGRPACNVRVRLDRFESDGWHMAGAASTDDSGRIEDWGHALPANGAYRLVVDAGRFFATLGLASAQTEVTIAFSTRHNCDEYHVPVLLAPFGYATYTGMLP